MRRLLGGVGFCIGLVALGGWAKMDHALGIEARLSASAAVRVEQVVHGVSATVSGRDISISGMLDGVDERDAILSSLRTIPGVRRIRIDATILPTIAPFEITLTRDPQKPRIQWRGHIPTEAARAGLATRIGADQAANLTLAAGAPDDEWTGFALQGQHALTALQSGRFVVSDRTGTLTGIARSIHEQALAEAALAVLPEGYTVEISVTALDDGAPFAAKIVKTASHAQWLQGKLPRDLADDELDAALGQDVQGLPVHAAVDALGPEWGDALKSGLAALAHLETGELALTGRQMEIKGTAHSSKALRRAEASIAILPEGFHVVTGIATPEAKPIVIRHCSRSGSGGVDCNED